MPQLDFSTYPIQLLWLLLSFSALYFLVKYVFLPGIESRIADRSLMIEKNILVAEQVLEDVANIKKKTDELLQEARVEARSILDQSELDIKLFTDTRNRETDAKCIELKKLSEEESEKFMREIVDQIPNIVEEIKIELINKITDSNNEKRKVRRISS